MKTIKFRMLTILLLAFLTQNAFSQTLELKNSQVEYEKTYYPCIEVMLEPTTDEVKDAWSDFIKDKYDIKLRGYGFLTNKDVLKAEETLFKAISDKQMDFYTSIVESEGQTRFSVFASFGYDIHVDETKYPKEYAAIKDIIKRFLRNYLPGYYEDSISSAQKTLKALQDNREDMEKEMGQNKEEIQKLTKRNEELEKLLSENKNLIEETTQSLNAKERAFKEVRNSMKSF